MRRGFKVHDQRLPHFVTSTTVHWIPVFCKDCYTRVLVDSFIYCIQNNGLLVHGFVIMPTHFHAVVSCSSGRISDVMRDLKGHTADELLGMLARAGRPGWMSAFRSAGRGKGAMQLWQPGFHPEQVHTGEFLLQKLGYMHTNPVRAGHVSDPCAWIYSSAAFYEGVAASPIPVTVLEG